ncbi:MAG: hypothetical protein H6613_03410 [Ignavibacteriales bacterium]|nr:hypothetical protein [Ignavibacteriales bacterium]
MFRCFVWHLAEGNKVQKVKSQFLRCKLKTALGNFTIRYFVKLLFWAASYLRHRYTAKYGVMKMKNILFLLIILFVANCKDDVNSSEVTYFNPDDITKLSIESLDDFWQGDSIFIDDYVGAITESYEGFLDGLEYRSENKSIAIHVFNSKKIAIDAMNKNRQSMSAWTNDGDLNEYFNENWFHVGDSYKTITVNKNNTVLYISNGYSEVENISINIAMEIINRIVVLSQ